MSVAHQGPDPAAAAGRGIPRQAPVRVALACEHELIAQALVASLSSRAFDVVRLVWPLKDRSGARPDVAALEPDVALLVYEIDSALRMAAATELIRSWEGPWLVLAGSGDDELVGGLLAAGAAATSPKESSLADVEESLHALAEGRPSMVEADRDRLIATWRDAEAGRRAMQARIESLTPRERQTLELLRDGWSVRDAAQVFGVSDSTVRSHVRAILGKLGVKSQLAAVVALISQDEEFPNGDRDVRP